MTLLFSAVTAFISIVMQASFGIALVVDIVAIALLWFVLPRTANSASGIPVIFGITGLLGFGLGPLMGGTLRDIYSIEAGIYALSALTFFACKKVIFP